jgi:tetraacyldisaccharide 4'-kinase
MRAPEFWYSRQLGARACAAALAPLGALYGLSVRARHARSHPFRPKARVLCVGNLTAGGSGKTPVAIALARMVAARGRKVVFLSRGYGGNLIGPVVVDLGKHCAEHVGDEPLLHATVAPAVVAHDRARGAQLADSLGADVIVMDDGFQNFQLAKDLSLVVVDAETGFGNGRVIPAGPLREPVEQGLKRADAVVVVGTAAFAVPAFRGPVLRAQLRPSAGEKFRERPVFAMAGIGRPEKFFRTLEAAGARIAGTKAFPDHHEYTARELESVKRMAAQAGAVVVTTEKDFFRIAPPFRDRIMVFPVHAAFADDAELGAILDRLLQGRA